MVDWLVHRRCEMEIVRGNIRDLRMEVFRSRGEERKEMVLIQRSFFHDLYHR